MRNGGWYIFLAGLALAAGMAGCVASTPQGGTLYQRLQSEDPAVRIDAIIQAGNRKDTKAIALLVDRLDDVLPDVRLFASISLRKITGKDFGWRHYDPPGLRDQAIGRWRKWVSKQHAKRASTSAPASGPAKAGK